MKTVDDLIREIIMREGGFVNDPDDPGGATKHGVTIGTMRRLGMDVDGDGDVDVADVRALTQSKAHDIYRREYYERPKISALPRELRASVLDMQVNSGSNAVRILQRLLNDAHGADLIEDGQIGPATAGAAYRAAEQFGAYGLADAYGVARRNYYYALADARPRSRKYAKRRDGGKGGWITRAEEFISPELHLTDAQHRARVAAWA